jgi:hypothetical protein
MESVLCPIFLEDDAINLMAGTAGIAAKKYFYVKYFPKRPAYNDYYDIAVAIGEVGVESFATLVQEMLVDYLCTKYGDKVAYWCHDFCTGECGRMCLQQQHGR